MILISKSVYARYCEMLKKSGVAVNCHSDYIKWLRYFLDFCARYTATDLQTEQLCLAGYDIGVIQNLLGHASLKTTMIYTHCVPVRTVKEPRSPLDL